MEQVDQDELVDAPQFGVLFLEFQKEPADTGKWRCHLQQCANDPNIMGNVVVYNAKKHPKSKQVMGEESLVEMPEPQVGQDQTGEFENEKSKVDVADEMRGKVIFLYDVDMKVIVEQEIPDAKENGPEPKQTPHDRC